MSKYALTGQPCPLCNSSDSMATFHDHGGYCFSGCGYVRQSAIDGTTDTMTAQKPKTGPRWSLEEIQDYPLADLSHRGIKPEAVEKYGVLQAVRQDTGEPDKQSFFYRSGAGQGWKRKNALLKRDMEVVGEYGGLFGQQVFPRGGRFLIITEGEEDALAIWQTFAAKGKDYSVVSLANGAGAAGLDKRETWDYVTSFERVLLAFDSDEAGQEAVEKFAGVYATEVKLKVLELPDGCKDANDCIKQGREDELLRRIYQSKEYQPELVIPGSDVSLDLISEPIKPGYNFRQYPDFSKKLGGLRDGELGIVMAPPGVGKSTWVAELGYDLIANTDEKVAWLFLEEDLKKSAQRLIALDNNVPLPRYRLDPGILPQEQIKSSYDKLINNDRTWFIDLGPQGRVDVNRLLHMLRYYHAQGVTRFIFDHISIVFSHDDRDNERKLIDNVLSEVAAFCAATGCTMIMVAHIRRFEQKINVKDEVNDAVWTYIDPSMARGSGSFEQLAFWIAALEPEVTENEEKGRARISIKKNREWGTTGPADILQMDMSTGRLHKWEAPEYDY